MASLQKPCIYNGNSFDVTVCSSDSYEELKQKCLRKVQQRYQPGDGDFYQLLLKPTADAVCGNITYESIESIHLIETSKLIPTVISDAIDDREFPDEYSVFFQTEYKKVRVDGVDSLKTFLEKVRDVYGDIFHVDKVNTIYQEIDGRDIFIYNVDEPGNRDLKKPIEHASQIVKDMPLIVTVREDSPEEEEEGGQLHFSLGNDDYKRLQFEPTAKLGEIIKALDVKNPENVDLRLKARSVFNKARAHGMATSLTDVTVGECGLTRGDVIEVVENGNLPPITCSLMFEGKREKPSNLAAKSGVDVREWKRSILKELVRNVDYNNHILFETLNNRDNIEYCRALYNMEELSIVANDDINLVLWMNCEYVDISEKKITPRRNEFEWPWGNKDYDFWTWGLKVSRRKPPCQDQANPNKTHYFLRTVVDGKEYINVETSDYVEEIERKSKIPGTDIDDKALRDISLFIAFFNRKTILIDAESDRNIFKYERNNRQRRGQHHPNVNYHLFWKPCS